MNGMETKLTYIYNFKIYVLGSQEDGTQCGMRPPGNNTFILFAYVECNFVVGKQNLIL